MLTNDLTYKIIGADGKEYGPVALSELQKWVGEGRITGATQVSRSDQQSWSTAASLPELGVRDSTGPTPVAAATAADALRVSGYLSPETQFTCPAGPAVSSTALANYAYCLGFRDDRGELRGLDRAPGYDVMPILAKAGCNSTACHGSPAGKNGPGW